jgi:TRAP-type C4-dicarboxylate transport system substrate-binding protein
MNKKWFEALPADLQKVVRDDAAATDKEIVPFVKDFYAAQRKAWSDKGGELIALPADEEAAFLAKVADIGDTLSKDKPDLNKAVGVVVDEVRRNK